MSLYNYLFGTNENKEEILKMIDINDERVFDRFRDIEIIENGTIIRVLTRTGGGNREGYQENWAKIKELPYYIQDYDDEFDETYAYIEFRVPGEHIERAKQLNNENPQNIEAKFKNEITEMNEPDSEASKRAQKLVDYISDAIIDDLGNKSLESVDSLHKTHKKLTKTSLLGSYIAGCTTTFATICNAIDVGKPVGNLIIFISGLLCAGTCWYHLLKRNEDMYKIHREDREDWLEAIKTKK